ncbi:MAG TPA: CvpA family protein [Pirellulales bacterium]|nr:CvpA family protein [Pirellulales bacterium]
MQPYDIAMIAVLAIAAAWGFYKGMAWQVAALVSLAASYWIALQTADELAPHLSSQAPWNKFLAMLLIYLATSLVVWIVFSVISGVIERVKLRAFDRQVGGVFGLAKGGLLCVVITFFAVTMSPTTRDRVLESRSGYYIAWFLHEATPIMPREVRELLGPYLHRLNRGLNPRVRSPA